jgi:tRNA threonylcarbamoyladenosine biosynthesis protein TsaB
LLVLAIDSATPVAGVALVAEDRVIKEIFLNYRRTHSQTLMVMVNEVLRETETSLADLDGIAVTSGPGSFTGLRIGMATAKGLALGSGRALVGIPTLDALAYNLCMFEGYICPLLDARKNEVYTALYQGQGGQVERISEYRACSPSELVEDVCSRGIERVAVLGDGARRYQEHMESLGSRVIRPPANLCLPRASSVGLLAVSRLQRGESDQVHDLIPVYVRLSEAENRLASKGL